METKKPNQTQPIAEEMNMLQAMAKRKKEILWGFIAVVVIIVVLFIISLVRSNKANKVDELVGKSDIEMTDSVAVQLKKQAAEMGTKSGNRAALEVAIDAYSKGDYDTALEYLKKASVKSNIVEAGRYSLMGDCYVNKQQLDEAVGCFKNAIKEADNNPQIVPFVLVKLANVYNAQGKYDDAYKAYEQILSNYPQYVNTLNQSGIDVRKLAARAQAQAGK